MASDLCITKDALLRKPLVGLTYPSVAQEISPFTMNGSPLTVPPQSLVGLTEFRRLPTATKDTSNMKTYFVEDNYYTINLATENIIGADTNTSLRFQNQNFTLTFMAIHSAIWETTGTQVSLLFTSANGHMFHICIPITYDGNVETANPFLNAWLTQPSSMPTGFTVNQILNFDSGNANANANGKAKASFATLEYCLLYNYGEILKPYTFCIFQTPLKVVQSTLPTWLASDLNLTKPQTLPSPQGAFQTYRRKSYDEIFNFIMRGVINVYIYDNRDPYLIGTEQHFDSKKTQSATNPAYFIVSSKILSGGTYSLFNNSSGSAARGLKNIKCYPIDLVTQVDSEGNIFIDEKTNKPINIKDVVSDDIFNLNDASGSTIVVDASQNEIQISNINKTQSSIRFIVAFSIIFLILISIIIVLVVYIFKGTTFFGSAAVGVNAASPANAAFAANAVAAPIPTPTAPLAPA